MRNLDILNPLIKEKSHSNDLDLNELIIKHPAATFFVRAEGSGMKNLGINSGDILVVDRSLTPVSGKIVICILKGEFLVRKLNIKDDVIFLQQGNPRSPLEKVDSDFEIWGVVTYVIHKC